jgi:hypothetical protein
MEEGPNGGLAGRGVRVQWLQYFKNGEVFLFSVGSALTLFCYVNGKESIKPTFLSLMNWLWA